MFRSIPFATALCIFASVSLADEIYVPQHYSTIQAAINASCDGDEIIVGDGTYAEAIDFLCKHIVVRSTGGPEVTVIDATDCSTSAVVMEDLWVTSAKLDGFTITGGTGKPRGGSLQGGGIYIEQSGPTISNCILTGNTAGGGGGVSQVLAWATIENCVFRENTATEGGDLGGGAVHSRFSDLTMVNCSFVENTGIGSAQGGGVCNDSGSALITNCRFWGNHAVRGGGLSNLSAELILTNCTFSGNTATYGGGGLLSAYSASNATIINCVFWGDSSDNYDNEICESAGPVTMVLHSIVQGGWQDGPGEGVIDEDPLFVDADGGDLRLLPGSPCIDSGDTMAFLETGLDCDLEGNPRPVAGNQGNYLGPFLRRVKAKLIADVDMGAYEFQP